MGTPAGVTFPGQRSTVIVGSVSTEISPAYGPRPLSVQNTSDVTIWIQTGANAAVGAGVPIEVDGGQVFDTSEAIYAVCSKGGATLAIWQGDYIPQDSASPEVLQLYVETQKMRQAAEAIRDLLIETNKILSRS